MPHSLASSDSVSSSRSLSTIPPTLQQLPDLPRQDLQNLIASISQSATLITQVYPRLRSIEKVLDTARPRFDPSTLRYLLPDAFVKAILVHLPAADFSVSSRDTVGKLHKVCHIWQIDSKLLLFQIRHDYGKKRGQPFFTALLVLAKLNHKWDSCLKLLINQVSVRQRLGGRHKCIQRVDVQNVITILTPPRNSVSETDSNEPTPIVSRPNQEPQQATHSQASTCKAFPSHKSPAVAATNAVGVERQDSDLDSNIDSDLDSDLDSNIELDIQVDQDLNQNIDATNEHKNFPQERQPVATSASSKAPLKAPPAVRDSLEASLEGTLSEEQTSLDQDRHQKRHLTGAEEDREIEESEEPEKARRTSLELGYTLPKTQKAPPGTDVEYQHDLSPPSLHSPLLLSFPLSSPSRSPTPEANHHFDVELKGHTFPEADVEGERREADKNTDGTNNTPSSSSFPTKRCLSFSETDSQFTLVPVLPNMEGKDQADGPKRFRVEPSSPLVPAEETDALLLDTTWVKGALLNGALGSLCDLLAPDVCYLDSAEVSRMAEDKYSPRAETLSLILASKTVVLPLHVCNNHWTLAIVRKARFTTPSAKLYDSMTSDKHTNAAQQLIGAFFKHYLPQTPYFSRLADPCLTNRQTNGSDCGIFAFATGIFRVTQEDVPDNLHGGLWRRVLAACLGGRVIDWDSLLPVARCQSPNKDVVDVSSPSTLVGDRFEQFEAARQQLEKRREALTAELNSDMIAIREWHNHIASALAVLESLRRAAPERIEQLQAQLETATSMESVLTLVDGHNRGPSSVKIDRQCSIVRQTRVRVEAVIEHLQCLADKVNSSYEEWSQRMKSVTGQDPVS